MNKPPAFQFYPDDFVGGTAILNTEEVGAYILLLCYQWSTGSVPNDDDLIRRIAKLTQAYPIGLLKMKFRLGEDGMLRNDRLERERAKQVEYREKQRKNGEMGGRPKGLANPSLSQTQSQTEPKKSSPSPSPSPKERKKEAFEKPTLAQVRFLAHKSGLPEVEADKFFYHYDSKGWKVGKEPMKSLNSAIGGWTTRWRDGVGKSNGKPSYPKNQI